MSESSSTIRKNFWDALEAEGTPRIEDFLKITDDSERLALFRDCIVMELNFCSKRGIRFDRTSMEKRFPQFSNVLEEVCRIYADSANDTFESTAVFKRNDPLPDEDDKLNASPVMSRRTGRYRLDQVVGRGGFGEVWKAYDPDLDRIVAVKIPRGDRHFSPELLQSFLNEARCVAKLRIPGVVSVYDVGQEGSNYYIVSDFINGETLADRMRRERLSWRDSVLLLANVSETLHRAHLKDFVHRDIKPSNILLDRDGSTFVADFGLAISEREQLQESPSVLGTFAYMSPEQARGDSNRVDARADIYSLGVIMYQLLTNRLPFLGATADDYLQQIQHRDARPPRTVDDSIPKELERICLKCLCKSAADRYSTARDFACDLRAWSDTDQSQSRPRSNRPLIMMSIVTFLLAVLCVVAWLKWPRTTSNSANSGSFNTTTEGVGSTANVPGGGKNEASLKSDQSLPPIEPPTQTALERTWNQQMGQSPLEILWPGYQTGGFLGFRNDVQGFEVISEPARLVKLSVLNEQPRRIGLNIEQPVWGGFVGLFLGYREVTTEEGPTAQMQLFAGARQNLPEGRIVYRIRRSITRISPKNGYLNPVKELGFVDMEWPKDSTPVRIELEFRDARFVRGMWGQTVLPFENLQSQSSTSSEDYVGPWGIYSQKTTSWFRSPTQQLLERYAP